MDTFAGINDPNDIDLNKHAIIEASAGTGKTFTITALVMRLLGQGVPLEKILIVTFTEKATAELRDRIRIEIKDRYEKLIATEHLQQNGHGILQSPLTAYFKQALNSFANAKIFTIHGFCQRVLQENAFENKGVFDLKVIDDKPLYRQQLNHIKRTWPAKQHIEKRLREANVNQKWEDDVISLAMKVDLNIDSMFAYEESQAQLIAQYNTQLGVMRTLDKEKIVHEFEQVRELDGCAAARWNTNNLKYFIPAWEFIRGANLSDECPYQINQAWSKKGLTASCFSYYPKLLDDDMSKMKHLHYLREFFTEFELFERIRTKLCHLRHQALTIETIKQLQEGVSHYKSSQGLMSFNDMINHLYDSLRFQKNHTSPALANKLRQEFQFGLIDEFQDTDVKQWEIFKAIFMGSKTHRLMLIGDPKQAIYSFRGADVNAYENAKQELLMLGEAHTQGYKLATNYRSMPDLIESLNHFWQQGFYPNDEANVGSPDEAHRQKNGPLLTHDHTQYEAFNILKLGEDVAGARALQDEAAKHIANTIIELNANLTFKLKGQHRGLNYSDICILVRRKAEANILEKVLCEQAIPASFYKKPGIYQSTESIHFQLLLNALAMPNRVMLVRKALLTLFVGLTPEQIPHFEAEKLPIKNRYWLKLLELAQSNEWPRFFNTLLEESGALYQATAEKNWRGIANVKQIARDLEQAAIEEKLDIMALSLHLADRCVNSKDEDLHDKDTEMPTVKILTMHSSKGLEFPVVFLFGAFSKGNGKAIYHKYYDPDKQNTVYDLTKTSQEEMQYDDEQENKRLFYVAFTRAVFKLFIFQYDTNAIANNFKGPYSSLVNPLLNAKLLPPVSRIIDVYLGEAPQQVNSSEQALPLLRISAKDTRSRMNRMYSFSGLTRAKYDSQQRIGGYGDDLNNKYPDEVQSEEPPAASIDSETDLPHGAKTGNVLHGIFENIDFSRVGQTKSVQEFTLDANLMKVVQQQMQVFGMKQCRKLDDNDQLVIDYEHAFASFVWHTLNKKIGKLHNLRLADIALHDRKHELEFHLNYQGRYLKGFIDLFFRVGDDFYILDWKSNFSKGGYAPSVLENSTMQDHHYDLQYQLYALAMQQWFDTLQLKNARLSGALYLFSRGINANEKHDNGIYFNDFTELDLTKVGDNFTERAIQMEKF